MPYNFVIFGGLDFVPAYNVQIVDIGEALQNLCLQTESYRLTGCFYLMTVHRQAVGYSGLKFVV